MINLLFITGAFWIYVILVWLDYGVQPSISASYYSWPEDNSKPWTNRLLFMLMTFICGINFIVLIPEWYGFIAGGSLAIVGVAANFRNKNIGLIHNICSHIAILMALLSIGLYYGHWWNYLYLFFFLCFVGLSKAINLKNKTWWIEIMAMILVQFGLLINMI